MSPKHDGHLAAAARGWPSFGAPKICEIDECNVIQSGTHEQVTTVTASRPPRRVRSEKTARVTRDGSRDETPLPLVDR